MLYGCLFDLVRWVLVIFTFACALLFGATLWLGPRGDTFVPVSINPDVQFDVTVRGPSPDLDVTVVRHVLFRETFQHIITVRVRAVPLAVTTIVLCVIAWAMDWFGWQRLRR